MDESVSYHFATVKQRRENRHEIDYQLTLRQQPKQSRMCGVGEKADRRPIDPPPIVQLKVIDAKLPSAEKNAYLQNPYYFMYASLMAADLDEELHLLRDGKTRSTTGSVVSSLYHLKDIDNTDAGFFVFPDLSVRMEGSYRLKLSLFEIIGKEVFHCRSIISNKFFVYSAKKFPGMEESTFLSRSFADQGLKIRIRKELRQRRKLSKISDTEDKDANSSVTPSPTSTHSKKAKTYKGTSDESPPTLGGAMSSSNSTLTTSTASTTTPTLPTATINSHYRVDLPPNPTRYISYSSKQQPDAWTSLPQSSSPLGSNANRYYAQEESSNTNVDRVQQQPAHYFVHSDPYHSHSQASLKYPLPTAPSHPPSSQQQQHEQQPMSFHNHSSSGSRMNPPLFYYSSNYPNSSLPPPPPPSQSTSTQQPQHHSQQQQSSPPSSSHLSQHLPPPP
ncbi:hypothetical protein V8B55DRAFT_1557012 [Mucor lusitanicus]|uniref:Velvet domain-containing protein n=2 Tax=Mucor circinelloides f. lusitanicus TaxID=29924 RepID=A0A168HDI1_MUCCL|nr:hypothetical protein FB192DRAFT_1406725 [Mucor lusitanicus]OAC98660.1 hypothetical protein MUCCIDRAFT_114902 [Mucor lusitanicus CBS 277.49]